MYQGCNHRGNRCDRARENVSYNLCDGRQNIGWDRVKVSENLGATSVAPVAPVVTSLVLKSPSPW